MTQNKFAIQKVLKSQLANIDMTDKDGYIVLSITEDASIYVNKNDGSQLKLTDLIVLTSAEQLEEVEISENKLVIVNPEDEDAEKIAAYIKINGQLVDIFADINSEIAAVATNLGSLQTALENTDARVEKLETKVTSNTNHLIISIDELNAIRKREATKNYKAIIPLSNVREGLVDPILPVSSFTFDSQQKVTIKSVNVVAVGNFDDEVSKLELELKYNDGSIDHEVGLITIDSNNKIINQEIELIQEFTTGYYFINVTESTGAKNVKITLTLLIERTQKYEELEKPTGDVIEEQK